MNKRGMISLGQMAGVIMMLVVVGIMLVVGSRVESDLQSDMTQNTTEWNAAADALTGLGNVSEQQGLLGTIIIFGVIISAVVVAFATRG